MKAYASMAVAVLNGADPATVGTVPSGVAFIDFAAVVRDFADTLDLPIPEGYRVEDLTPPDTLTQSQEDILDEERDYWNRVDELDADADELDADRVEIHPDADIHPDDFE